MAVAVWTVGPSLVHVTVSPTWIVMLDGVKTKSEIVSDGSPAKCATAVRGRATSGTRLVTLGAVRSIRFAWACGFCEVT